MLKDKRLNMGGKTTKTGQNLEKRTINKKIHPQL